MYRRVGLPLLLAGLVLVAAPSGASPGHKRSGCPEKFPLGGSDAELRVHHMSCKTAKRIVLLFYGQAQGVEDPHLTVRGFDCHGKSGSGFPVVKCRKGEQRLRYEGGFYKSSRSAGEKPRVGCWNGTWPNEQGTEHPQFYVAPKKCAILKRGAIAIVQGDAIGRNLKWNWGKRVARARGEIYISSAGFHPGRLKLSKPVVSCGRLVFSKVLARINPDHPDAENFHYSFRIYTC